MNGISTKPAKHDAGIGSRGLGSQWKWEAVALLGLAALVAFFLKTSWRKWPDPIVDFGQQCYSFWRISQGARIYHDFVWNYGPLSACFNALLFKFIGPGIMVLAVANLAVYGGILVLAYAAFRRAWGWVGAFAALAVFISVFSFSHLLAVGNYNYVTPYSSEATHGMLLILVTAFVAARWYAVASRRWAFALGLCGGLAAVIKPEFMLATGVVGFAAYVLRWVQHQRVKVMEHFALLIGVALPTAAFTLWFTRTEAWPAAFIDASSAWWLVVVDQIQRGSGAQQAFSGFNHPMANALAEARWSLGAFALFAMVWVVGWFVNRNWSVLMKMVTALAAIALAAFFCRRVDWMGAGRGLPGVLLLALLVVSLRARGELRRGGIVDPGTVMALFLILLAGTMLARMALYPHIFHLGFFQAALAGMVAAALLAAELPRWTGPEFGGRCVASIVALGILAFGCGSVAAVSNRIRADQTQSVGSGWDRFYSTTRNIDGTGVLVDAVSDRLRSAASEATLLVLPDGLMINYLSRHKTVEPGPGRGADEKQTLATIRGNPPDYVVLITRDLSEFGIARYGAPGNLGHDIMTWVFQDYTVEAHMGGDPLALDDHPGVVIFRRKSHG